MRQGAEQIVETAFSFGIGLDKLRRPDGHEAGRKWFPSLVDRLHLGAVIAKCGVFCAQAEELWPEESFELVERYNRHLGLDLPQHSQAHHERHREQVEEPHTVRTEPRERSHDDDDDDDHGL